MQLSEQTLAEVGKRVLESMAYAVISADPVTVGRGVTVWEGTVCFSGPLSGSASMRMPEPVLAELSSNALGLQEGCECSEQQRRDVLGELTNVFCGNLLEALSGADRTFDLATPEVKSAGRLPCIAASKTQCSSARVDLDNGWVELCLALEDTESEGTI